MVQQQFTKGNEMSKGKESNEYTTSSIHIDSPEIEDAEVVSEVPMTKQQQIESMAARFEHHGVTPDELRYMAAKLGRKIRTDATKPVRNEQKEKAKRKAQKVSRRVNRKK